MIENCNTYFEELRCSNQKLTFTVLQKAFSDRNILLDDVQLKKLKLIRSEGDFSNVAMLLSDQNPSTLKIVVFQGKDTSVISNRAEFSGSLLQQLTKVYDYIDGYNTTDLRFKGLEQIEVRNYPIDAIKEALCNAIVHRDYSYDAPILINIFNNHIEFVSVGGLVNNISYGDIMLGISIQRNKALADVFYKLKLIEACGIGISKIMDSYSGHLEQPKIEVSDNAFKLSLPNINKSNMIVDNELTERELKVIQLLETENSINRKKVQEVLFLSQTVAITLLHNMVEKGIFCIVGEGRNTRYKLAKKREAL